MKGLGSLSKSPSFLTSSHAAFVPGLRSSRRTRTLKVCANSIEYDALKGLQVTSAASGDPVDLLSLWMPTPGLRCVIPFMSHFGDLTSWELAQKLVKKVLPVMESRNIKVIAVGLGSPANAREFSRNLGFPLENLYADPTGACYTALGFSPGFGAGLDVNPYLKLLPMLAGIGSPGTLQEVIRGYVGDRESKPVFEGETPFNILGGGYQRPFELATLRLQNMVGILPKWTDLCPPKTELLTQQGGVLVFDGTEVIFEHKDAGILMYADVDELLKVALSPVRLLTTTDESESAVEY